MNRIRTALIVPTNRPQGHYPASTTMPAAMFPIVDRDGLTKPVLQIVAEEAMQSGIDAVGIVVDQGSAARCREHFDQWSAQTPEQRCGEDWQTIEREHLAELRRKLTFIERTDPTADWAACRKFVGDDAFLLLPSDSVFLSGTKDRCACQLIERFDASCGDLLVAVRTVQLRDLPTSTLIRAEATDATHRLLRITAFARQPALDASNALASPVLPPGYFFASTEMAISSPAVFDLPHPPPLTDLLPSAIESCLAAGRPIHCVSLAGQSFDVRLPYGLLETQLGLGLAGVHRAELCEMIARTLAAQAKN